jgi:hypothetical protein
MVFRWLVAGCGRCLKAFSVAFPSSPPSISPLTIYRRESLPLTLKNYNKNKLFNFKLIHWAGNVFLKMMFLKNRLKIFY